MNKWIKTVLIALIVAFCIFYLVKHPTEAADKVKIIFTAIDSLGRFFSRLAS